MSIDFNSVVLCGNLTADPQKKDGFIKFSIAVRDKGTMFIPVSVHEKMCSEKTLERLQKGVGVLVNGRISYTNYQSDDGVQKKHLSVQAQTIQVNIPGSINNVVLFGRLTSNPEIRATPSGQKVASVGIANNYAYKSKKTGEWVDAPTSFFNVTAWDKTAEFLEKYFKKGSAILVAGKIVARQWETKSGEKATSYEIVANQVSFAQSNKSDEQAQPVNGAVQQNVAQAQVSDSFENAWETDFTEIDDGEDLPF